MTATGKDRCFRDGLVAFHKYFFCHSVHLPFYLNYAIRAHHRTGRASNARGFIRDLCRVVTFFIDLILCQAKKLFGTSIHAQAATFTDVRFECKFCHFYHLVM
jgi:hypothetical protein